MLHDAHGDDDCKKHSHDKHDNPTRRAEAIVWLGAGAMREEQSYFVYILASKRNGTLYTGITSRLLRRIWEHRNDVHDGFTKKYRVHILVCYEQYSEVSAAIAREKQLKGWNRAWKLKLIEKMNPEWEDLYYKRIAEEGYSIDPQQDAEKS
jgi:putative endonuclease